MVKLLQYAHIFLLLAAGYFGWQKYDEFSVEKETLLEQLPIMESKIIQKERQIKSLKKYYEDIEAAKARIEIVAKEVEKRQKQFPDKISDTENLQLFADAAKELNMKDVYLSPEREDIKDFYITKEYSFKASGTFLQFLIFLSKIENQTRLFNIKSVEYSKSDKKQKGRFQLINGDIRILAYRYNPAHDEKRGFEEIDQEFENEQKEKAKTNVKADKQNKKALKK